MHEGKVSNLPACRVTGIATLHCTSSKQVLTHWQLLPMTGEDRLAHKAKRLLTLLQAPAREMMEASDLSCSDTASRRIDAHASFNDLRHEARI